MLSPNPRTATGALPRFSPAALILAIGLAAMLAAIVGTAAWTIRAGTAISASQLAAAQDAAYARGQSDGLAEGTTKGVAKGRAAGARRGFLRGRRAGYRLGLLRGRAAGYRRGRTAGYAAGYAAGTAAPRPATGKKRPN